jgi:antitoxin FitA
MAKLLVRDLNPEIIERLEARAQAHGRSVQAKAKEHLEAPAPLPRREALRIAREWQRRLAGRVTGDSADLIREDRER